MAIHAYSCPYPEGCNCGLGMDHPKPAKEEAEARRSAAAGSPSSAIGDGFYRNAAPGTFGPSEWLDLMLAVQDGRCSCMKAKEIIEREIDARLENPPKHDYWAAGDPECPKEIKAGNGELHTLRCKKCWQDSLRSPICREFNPENSTDHPR